MAIKNLVDLNNLRSAPLLSTSQIKRLLREIEPEILNADWITVGIMAFNDYEAIKALQTICRKYSIVNLRGLDLLKAKGSVFLKANQKTGNVYIRSENGLGEGILLTCQYDEDSEESSTFGPLPLDFFT